MSKQEFVFMLVEPKQDAGVKNISLSNPLVNWGVEPKIGKVNSKQKMSVDNERFVYSAKGIQDLIDRNNFPVSQKIEAMPSGDSVYVPTLDAYVYRLTEKEVEKIHALCMAFVEDVGVDMLIHQAIPEHLTIAKEKSSQRLKDAKKALRIK